MNKFEQLEVGQVFKSYKQVCETLEEKVKSGDSKVAQLKEWERYFSFRKDGNKFIITEIHKEVKDKLDGRKNGNNTIYGDIVQLLIIDILMQNKDKHISISKSKLIESLGIANENYSGCKSNFNKLSQYLNISINYIYDFYSINDSNFTSIITRALASLEDKRIIMYNKIYKVKPLGEVKVREMSPLEMSAVQEIESDILFELNENKLSEIRRTSKWNTFKNKVKIRLHQETNIEYYYEAYDISINNKYIIQEKCELISQISNCFERENKKTELNNLVIDNIISNAEKRIGKSTPNKNKYNMRMSDGYSDNTKMLTSVLVHRKSTNIVSEVMNCMSSYTLLSQMKSIEESLPF